MFFTLPWVPYIFFNNIKILSFTLLSIWVLINSSTCNRTVCFFFHVHYRCWIWIPVSQYQVWISCTINGLQSTSRTRISRPVHRILFFCSQIRLNVRILLVPFISVNPRALLWYSWSRALRHLQFLAFFFEWFIFYVCTHYIALFFCVNNCGQNYTFQCWCWACQIFSRQPFSIWFPVVDHSSLNVLVAFIIQKNQSFHGFAFLLNC